MSDDVTFDRDFESPAGTMVAVSPLVRRIVAPNPSPFTFTGTCTYVVGRGAVAVIDPGPADAAHVQALLAGIAGETVEAIVVTHTHRDHSPGARLLQERTGAPIVGCAPHRVARPLFAHEQTRLDAGADADHAPQRALADGETLEGDGWTLTAVATPGHTANHLAFALPQERALFSGDHVMAWSTSIVAPPDGAMGDYMASLARLADRDDAVLWPGHGGPVTQPPRFVRHLLTHRRQRETSIVERLRAGDGTIGAIVPRLYEGLNPALHGAAALSVLAHVEDLVQRGVLVSEDGEPSLARRYRVA
ncbi:MAG: MBL fold metallo-hydrolase [Burkholderiales bacterium]|nr:MBL fold metallo-hydrolase [Burkholderiales bacterium]